MLVAFSVAPSGGPSGDSVAEAVAAAVRVVRESGLSHRTDAMFTTIEGPDWDTVMDVVKRATEAVQAHGTRVSLVLKADIRPGHDGELDGKVRRVEERLVDGRRRQRRREHHALVLEVVADARLDDLAIDRFGDVVDRPRVEPSNLVGRRPQRGNEDDRYPRRPRVVLQARAGFVAVDAGHHHVEQDDVR